MENNIFEGRTVDEAVNEGLLALCVSRDEIDVEVLENKKKLFGGAKVVVRITPKRSDAERAVKFIDGLLEIMGIDGNAEVKSDDEKIIIDVKTAASARVIGKRGDVLDAIQSLSGAVANIGRDEYRKVVVDCENYRQQREETLKNLANKLAEKAVETGRKIVLEPMSSYERRVIHAALMDNEQVKTASEGNEPVRYIVVIPNGADPHDRGIRYGEKPRRDGRGVRDRGGRRDGRDSRGRGDRRDGRGDRNRGERGERGARPAGGAKKGKREIHFGTFLGNSGATGEDKD